MVSGNKKFILLVGIIFLLGGIVGLNLYNFIESNKAFEFSYTWFGLPALILAVYGTYAVLGIDKEKSLLNNILKISVTALVVTSILLKSLQGYIIIYNSTVGPQTVKQISGRIFLTDYPRQRKYFSLMNYFPTYKIVIETNNYPQFINLEVPTKVFVEGQTLDIPLKSGSLGILYNNMQVQEQVSMR